MADPIQFQITDKDGGKHEIDYEQGESMGQFRLRCLNSGDMLAQGYAFCDQTGHSVSLDTHDPYFIEADLVREVEGALNEVAGFNE